MGEAFLRAQSDGYRARRERTTAFMQDQRVLFGDVASVTSTEVTANACGDVAPGAEVEVHLAAEGPVEVYRGLERVATLVDADAVEARRLADGRAQVSARVRDADPLLKLVRLELVRRPRLR